MDVGAARSFRPYDGAVNGSVEDSMAAEVDAAVVRAAGVAAQVAATAPRQRHAWWEAVAAALEAATEELATLADDETGLGTIRLRGEVGRAAGQLLFYSRVAQEGSHLGVTVDAATETTPELRRVHHPLGPVAVFGASNFPFAFGVLGHDTASALAAGCPVVVKAHPAHPLLSARLVELATGALDAAGAPAGVLSVVHGRRDARSAPECPGRRVHRVAGRRDGSVAGRA